MSAHDHLQQPANHDDTGVAARALGPAEPAVVEVFADVVCPFAHVGLRRLFERRDALGRTDIGVRVRAWPLELVNGTPLDGPHAARTVAALRARVAPSMFSGFDPDHFPTSSLPALALAAAAYRVSPACGEVVSLAVRDALFERGTDVADHDQLDRLATEHGLEITPQDAASVLADLDDGRRRGVRGSPHFFVGADGWFCPALAIERDGEGRLDVRPNRTAFDGFITACFGPPCDAQRATG
jgi:predicted DsbA family dithiol-disulfide isomerase